MALGLDAYLTLAVIFIAFICFAWELFPVDHVALGIMATLALTGVLSAQESLAGFANPATLTVAAMFVLGDALIQTGFIQSVGPWITRLFKRPYKLSIGGLSLSMGTISAFINNTPVVATAIPLIAHASRKTKRHPSRYLIPLSYGAIFGGTCTLIGTSTNLLVDGIARNEGLAGFSMFTFAPLGLVFFGVGTLYLMFFSKKLLPQRQDLEELEEDAQLNDFLTEIKIGERINDYRQGAAKEEEKIRLKQVFTDGKTEVEKVRREGQEEKEPEGDFALEPGDVLLVRGKLDRIKKILKNDFLAMSQQMTDRKFPEEATHLTEIIVLPNSRLIKERLGDLDFFDRYQSRVLAIRQRGKQQFEKLSAIKLQAGDVLLLQSTEEGRRLLHQAERKGRSPFRSLSESAVEKVQRKDLFTISVVLAAVIGLASLQMAPIVVAAFAGIFVLVAARIIRMEQAYKAIDWQVITLLAGALSLGVAMDQSGLSTAVARFIEEVVAQTYGPIAVVSALYLLTSILTEIMSNNAAAALLAPVAISIAQSLQLDPLPFLLAITFAGSASFMTPVGYQTNTMVYSAGKYRFRDFVRIGLPLNLLFWLLASWLIPIFYPF